MKIWIKSGSQTFDVCKGVVSDEFTEDLRINGMEMVQECQFLRAVVSKSYARGNTRTRVSFRMTKEHADMQTCEAFLLERHSEIPKTGDLLFSAESATGSGRTRTLSDAALFSHDRTQIGVTSIHSFEFVGGDFS
jgi:hypothetical protein